MLHIRKTTNFPRTQSFVGALLWLMVIAAQAAGFEDGVAPYLGGDYASALKAWRPLAEQGHARAQFNLGVMHANGQGLKRDDAEAVKWYTKAAEQGYAPAQFNLGSAYKNGQGVAASDKDAAKWWRKAADQGFALAQYNLGSLYYYGQGVSRDEAEAIRWYRKAAENGDPSAQHVLGLLEGQDGGATVGAIAESAKLPEVTQPAATEGKATPTKPAKPVVPAASASAAKGGIQREAWLNRQNPQHYTIQVFADGSEQAVVKQIEESRLPEPVAYFRSDRDGKPWYSAVHGVYPTLDAAKAALAALPNTMDKWSPWVRSFRTIQKAIREAGGEPKPGTTAETAPPASNPATPKAVEPPKPPVAGAALEEGQAAFNAGNYALAASLWQPLAEKGVARAQYNLGFLHESGWGVAKDFVAAARWYQAAADQGDPRAQYNLGSLYLGGQGVTRNDALGMQWIRKAAESGHTKARELLAKSYAEGRYGLPRDAALAKHWRENAK